MAVTEEDAIDMEETGEMGVGGRKRGKRNEKWEKKTVEGSKLRLGYKKETWGTSRSQNPYFHFFFSIQLLTYIQNFIIIQWQTESTWASTYRRSSSRAL